MLITFLWFCTAVVLMWWGERLRKSARLVRATSVIRYAARPPRPVSDREWLNRIDKDMDEFYRPGQPVPRPGPKSHERLSAVVWLILKILFFILCLGVILKMAFPGQ